DETGQTGGSGCGIKAKGCAGSARQIVGIENRGDEEPDESKGDKPFAVADDRSRCRKQLGTQRDGDDQRAGEEQIIDDRQRQSPLGAPQPEGWERVSPCPGGLAGSRNNVRCAGNGTHDRCPTMSAGMDRNEATNGERMISRSGNYRLA